MVLDMASQCRYRKGNSQQESGGCSEGGDDLNGRNLRSRSSRASFPMDLFLTAVLEGGVLWCPVVAHAARLSYILWVQHSS